MSPNPPGDGPQHRKANACLARLRRLRRTNGSTTTTRTKNHTTTRYQIEIRSVVYSPRTVPGGQKSMGEIRHDAQLERIPSADSAATRRDHEAEPGHAPRLSRLERGKRE